MTQKQKVIERIDEVGYVDNFWAIANYMLRLGAIIFELTKEGWEFRGCFGENEHRKNYYYYPIKRPSLSKVPANPNPCKPNRPCFSYATFKVCSCTREWEKVQPINQNQKQLMFA